MFYIMSLKLSFDHPIVIMDSETGGVHPKANVRWVSDKFEKDSKVEAIVVDSPAPILQIAAVKLNQQNLDEIDSFSTLVGPDAGESVENYLSRCNPQALEVNKLHERIDELREAPDIKKALNAFINWLPKPWNYIVAGQNVQFDLNFFNAKLEEVNSNDRFYGQPLELLSISRLYFSLPDTPIVANHKLENIASSLDIKTEDLQVHDALVDCRLTADVMRKMFKRFSLK